jgi:hypothetical protein
MKKSCLIALFVMCGMFAMTAHSQTVVPNTFLANTPAKAEEVNANFSKLATDLNTLRSTAASNVTRVVEITDSTGVGTASCATGEFVVGGGCNCTGNNSAGTNFGTVFACFPSGNSYIGGCYPLLYSSSYGASPIKVKVICMKAISGSGGVSALVMPKSPSDLSDPAVEIEKLKSLVREQQELQPGR